MIIVTYQVFGDFNAAVGGQSYREWGNLCDNTDMFFIDEDRLNGNSYTQINNATSSKSWLEHCLATRAASGSVENATVLYDYFLSYHLPLCIIIYLKPLGFVVRSLNWPLDSVKLWKMKLEPWQSSINSRTKI